ncbi:MAG: DUF3310 domain-containing protein [Paraclostridium sp.]
MDKDKCKKCFYETDNICYNGKICMNNSEFNPKEKPGRTYANMFVDDMKEKDNIKPSHYNSGKYDIIWFCQYHNISFDIGNIMKYIFRAGKKDKAKELEDLRKAKEYLERRIEFVEAKEK